MTRRNLTGKSKKKPENALSHGLYASEIVLPWEDETHFLELLNEFRMEYQPDGPTEKELTLDLARLRWHKRRMMRSAQLKFYEDATARRIGQATKGSFNEFTRAVEAEAANNIEIQEMLRRYAALIERELVSIMEQHPVELLAAEEYRVAARELDRDRLSLISKAATEFLVPLAKKIQGVRDESDIVNLAYSPDALEKVFRLEAMIDARFDKTLGRLLALQDYKRSVRMRQIEQSTGKRKRAEVE